MRTGRLEAFSDGVIAILITIMVLELHIPDDPSWSALHDELPVLLSYPLSFVYLGIYWNNHHHLLQATDRVDGLVLWANLHLLFWLSLVSFVTGWMGENSFATVPTEAYGVVLLVNSLAFYGLQRAIIRCQGRDGLVQQALGRDWKGKLSPVAYIVGILLTAVNQWLGVAIYVIVALTWLVPDRRISRVVASSSGAK